MLDIGRAMRTTRIMRSITGLDSKTFNRLLWSIESVIKKESIKQGKKSSYLTGGKRETVLYTILHEMLPYL